VIAQARFREVLQVINDTAVPVTEWFGKEAERHYDVVPDHLVKERETLTTGGVELVLYPVHGGETSDGLLIHLPGSGLLFIGDVMMPYLGAPFLPEGSVEGFFETIELIQRLRPRMLVHGHTGLTENVTIEIVPACGAALRELYDQVLASIREGETLIQVLHRNLLPAVLRSEPGAVLPYLLTRDNFIQRLYHQLRIPTKWPTQSDGNGPRPSEAAWRSTRRSGSAPEDHLLIDGLRVVWHRPATLAIGGLAASVRAGAPRSAVGLVDPSLQPTDWADLPDAILQVASSGQPRHRRRDQVS
jgi:glyoxylase-like metal-dependent hydrolase (beta-lactamase superfamily II)